MVPSTSPRKATGTPSTKAIGTEIARRAVDLSSADARGAVPLGMAAARTANTNHCQQFHRCLSGDRVVMNLEAERSSQRLPKAVRWTNMSSCAVMNAPER